MDQTAYTSEVQLCAGGFRKIGRPVQEDRAMVNITPNQNYEEFRLVFDT